MEVFPTFALCSHMFEVLINRLIPPIFFFFLFSLVSQFNFVGKLLGPRGNSMKRLQEETGVKMSILGKGSMRDKEKVRHVLICAEMWLFSCFEKNIYRNKSALNPTKAESIGTQSRISTCKPM